MRAILINQTNGGSNSFEECSKNCAAPRAIDAAQLEKCPQSQLRLAARFSFGSKPILHPATTFPA